MFKKIIARLFGKRKPIMDLNTYLDYSLAIGHLPEIPFDGQPCYGAELTPADWYGLEAVA